MSFYKPQLQNQFRPNDSTSRYDCTAAGGALLADADSKGRFVFNHHQVRWHTNEAVPAFLSPGLNWNQIDSSIYELTGGKVNLEIRPTGSSFAPVPAALRAGKWAGFAVRRGVLVDAGLAFGSPFRAGHAITAGFDQDRKVPIMADSLVNHWIDVSWALLERACAAFVADVGSGSSGFYGALTRDIYDVPGSTLRYSAIFTKGDFWRYVRLPDGTFDRKSKHFTQNTSAPAAAPVSGYLQNGTLHKLNEITKGVLKGYFVESGTTNVLVKVSK